MLEMTPEMVAVRKIIRGTFGRDAQRIEPLPGYEDRNFRAEFADGDAGVLKLTDAAQPMDEVDLQVAAIEWLHQRVSLQTARVYRTEDGQRTAPVQFDGKKWHAALLGFVDGSLWSEQVDRPSDVFEDLGRKLGELAVALRGFDHPAADRSLAWDLRRAGQSREGIELVSSPSWRRAAETALRGFHARSREFSHLPTSVIHGDVNDFNVIVNRETGGISGLIDFGDLHRGLTVAEPAITLAYMLTGRTDPVADAVALVGAYHQISPLAPGEIEALWPLMLTRLAVTVVMAARRRSEGATDPYLFVSEDRAGELLDRLIEISPAAMSQRFYAACGSVAPTTGRSPEELARSRSRHVGSNLSVAYQQPLKIVRGRGQYLFDHEQRAYLDLVNNVCHVGHCHPQVVAAGQRQMAMLNTNTRYLYDGLAQYTERLCSTLPDSLSVCYLVCSGSEANELALRLARAHTGRKDLVVLDGAYHGHTSGLIEISPYKFLGPGGSGAVAEHVHLAPVPDVFRGTHGAEGEQEDQRDQVSAYFSSAVERIIAESKQPIGAFMAESLLGCGGQIEPPADYFKEVFRHVRRSGGVCIMDEVQVGFGRVGTHFWGFERQGVVPDIVVMGKPIGNGHPMAAVVTTPEIAQSFANGMEFFSTFGGNPVSCAVGLAVLDVIEQEGLQERARVLGQRCLAGLEALKSKHALVGDVRGAGLFLGIELVRDHQTLEAADRETDAVVQEMRRRGFLLSTDGPLHNVIKIKPPMVLDEWDIDALLRGLDETLAEVGGKPTSQA